MPSCIQFFGHKKISKKIKENTPKTRRLGPAEQFATLASDGEKAQPHILMQSHEADGEKRIRPCRRYFYIRKSMILK
jgi:hypothetical protein